MKRFIVIARKIAVIVLVVAAAITIAGYFFMQQPSFGKSPSGERLARIEKCNRYSDGIFHNRIETPMYPPNTSVWESGYRFFAERAADNEPAEDIPMIKRDLKKTLWVKGDSTSSTSMTWFGHSTVLIQIGSKNILTDPQFSERASPVGFAGPKAFPWTLQYHVEDLPDIDAVLISHDHYDHLDYETIIALNKKTKDFFVPLGVASHLEHWNIPLEKIHEVDWWETSELPGGLKIVATPSRHFSGRGLSFNKTSWGSYVISMNGHNIFFSGDSGFDIHYKQIGEAYGPFDIAIIETGQYDKLWPFIHMMPEQSVQAAADLKAKKYLPIHWSKFALALHGWRDPIQRAVRKAENLNVQIVTPLPGELFKTDSSYTGKNWWRGLK
jgi:L-ascorbate metabolism protein UlaG (beta-lactamase superfamily)